MKEEQCKRVKLKTESESTDEEKDDNEKVTDEEKDDNEKVAIIMSSYSYLGQVTLGGMELIEREQGDAMGSENEEDDHESEMDGFDSDHDESGQDGVIGRFKEEEKYFSDFECPDSGLCGGTCGGKKLGLSKGKVAGHCGMGSGSKNPKNMSKDSKKSYSCSRIKSGLKLIIRKQ